METVTIDQERFAEVQKRGLAEGAHSSPERGMCAMEAVAYMTRQPFSDHPPCVSSVIGAFMRSFNDGLPDDERGILLPLLAKTLNTAGSAKLEERRSMMAIDWYIREYTPAFLRLAGMNAHADTLAGLSELTAQKQMDSIRVPLEAIQKDASAARSAARSAAGAAAWAAARSAAGAAAWAAAETAAETAAGAAARSAAGAAAWAAAETAAETAAGAAAWAAAGAAAWAAARSAAWAALNPTRLAVQASALKLIERMCEVSDHE